MPKIDRDLHKSHGEWDWHFCKLECFKIRVCAYLQSGFVGHFAIGGRPPVHLVFRRPIQMADVREDWRVAALKVEHSLCQAAHQADS